MKIELHRLKDACFPKLSMFCDIYGEVINSVYILYIVVLSTTFFFGIAYQNLMVFSIIATFSIVPFHSLITFIQTRKEAHPYQLLYHQQLKVRLFLLSSVSFFILMSMGIIMQAYSLKLEVGHVSLFTVVALLWGLMLSLTFSSAFFTVYTFNHHKECRLCLKLILEFFEKSLGDEKGMTQIAHKNLRWFKRAFSSCNSLLVEKPHSVELNEIDKYNNTIYGIALMGNSKEVGEMSRKIESVLNSLGKNKKSTKLRDLLFALKCIKQKDYSSDEGDGLDDLSDIWRATSSLERIKSMLRSPLCTLTVAIIAMILALLNIALQFLKMVI